MLHQIKAPQFILIWPPKTVLNPLANGKIQGPFKAFVHFEVLFKANFIFKDFQDRHVYSITFQACGNPGVVLHKLIYISYQTVP